MSLAGNVRLISHVLFYKLSNPGVRQYGAQWNRFWSDVRDTGPGGQVLWDSAPSRASEEDLARFAAHMDSGLPLIDFGCGNGRQTRFLARHFPRVIGVDVSEAAVALAQRESSGMSNVEFRVMDATRAAEFSALRDELGDANVYMRGVLHAIQRADRPAVVASLATLLGARGTLYQVELSGAALGYFRGLPGDSPSGLPQLLHRVVSYGIEPVGFSLAERPTLFPDAEWAVLGAGENVTINTVPLSHGAEGNVPANYLVLRRR